MGLQYIQQDIHSIRIELRASRRGLSGDRDAHKIPFLLRPSARPREADIEQEEADRIEQEEDQDAEVAIEERRVQF